MHPGTKLAISIILEWLENGKIFSAILAAYLFLTEEGIRTAVRYACMIIE